VHVDIRSHASCIRYLRSYIYRIYSLNRGIPPVFTGSIGPGTGMDISWKGSPSFTSLYSFHILSRLLYIHIRATYTVKMSASVNGKTSQKAVVCHGAVDLRIVSLSSSIM
jgi:hypothetical protein